MNAAQMRSDKAIAFLQSLDYLEDEPSVDLPALVAPYLQHADADVRQLALQKIVDVGDPTLFDMLMDMVEDDPSVEVQALALLALGSYVRDAVDFGSFGSDELSDLLADDEIDELYDFLWEQYSDEEAPDALRQAALQSLAYADDPDVETAIAECWQLPGSAWRTAVLMAMGNSSLTVWAPQVIAALGGGDTELQRIAAWAAGRVGALDAIPQLGKLARTAEDPLLRDEAILALGRLGDLRSLDALFDVIRSPLDEDTRLAAWYAIEDLKEVLTLIQFEEGDTDQDVDEVAAEVDELIENAIVTRLSPQLRNTRPLMEEDDTADDD